MFKNRILRLSAAFFTVILLFGLLAPAAMAKEKDNLIRVGMIQLKGYGDVDDNGDLSGVNVKYAYKLAQYANLNIQVFLFKNGKDTLAQLDAGKIDAMCNVIKTPEREKQSLFSSREIGSQAMCVFTDNKDTQYTYRNIHQLKSITFGAENVSKVKELFSTWCGQHGLQPAMKTYDNLDEIKAAVKSGHCGSDSRQSEYSGNVQQRPGSRQQIGSAPDLRLRECRHCPDYTLGNQCPQD